MDREKFTRQVNVALTDEQFNELHAIINESAPNLNGGQLIRIAWLYFLKQVKHKGLIQILGEVIGA